MSINYVYSLEAAQSAFAPEASQARYQALLPKAEATLEAQPYHIDGATSVLVAQETGRQFRTTYAKMAPTCHAPQAAIRAMAEARFESTLKLDTKTTRHLYVGASAREIGRYSVNPKAYFSVTPGGPETAEAKDVGRTMISLLEKAQEELGKRKLALSQAESAKGQTKWKLRMNNLAELIEAYEQIMDQGTPQTLPGRIVCGYEVRASTLISIDSAYNISSEQWFEMFEKTGATSAHVLAWFPHEILFPDKPESKLHTIEYREQYKMSTWVLIGAIVPLLGANSAFWMGDAKRAWTLAKIVGAMLKVAWAVTPGTQRAIQAAGLVEAKRWLDWHEVKLPGFGRMSLLAEELIAITCVKILATNKPVTMEMTYKDGHSNGYSHNQDTWSLLMKNPVLESNTRPWVIMGEIVARTGEHTHIKLLRVERCEPVIRRISLPAGQKYVRLVDLFKSYDVETKRMRPTLHWVKMREEEALAVINHIARQKPGDVSVPATMTMICRAYAGLSIASTEYAPKWKASQAELYTIAQTLTIIGIQQSRMSETIVADLRENMETQVPRWKKMVTDMLEFTVSVVSIGMWAVIADIIKYLTETGPSMKLMEDGVCEVVQRWEPTPATWCRSFNTSTELQYELDVEETPALKAKAASCEFHKRLTQEQWGKQQPQCQHPHGATSEQWTISYDEEEMAELRVEATKERDAETTLLQQTIDTFVDTIPTAGFTVKMHIERIKGGPGVGKSYTMRLMIKNWLAQGKKVVVHSPFKKLAPDYTEIDKNGKNAFNFYTTHKAIAAKTADIIVLDEYTAMDERIAMVTAYRLGATHLVILGDKTQTGVLEREGQRIGANGTKIPEEELWTHSLPNNFRNSIFSVAWYNKQNIDKAMQMYAMNESDEKHGLGLPQFKPYADCPHGKKVMTYSKATALDIGQQEGHENCIRSNQGSTHAQADIAVGAPDMGLMQVDEQNVVGFTRHRATGAFTFYVDDGPAKDELRRRLFLDDEEFMSNLEMWAHPEIARDVDEEWSTELAQNMMSGVLAKYIRHEGGPDNRGANIKLGFAQSLEEKAKAQSWEKCVCGTSVRHASACPGKFCRACDGLAEDHADLLKLVVPDCTCDTPRPKPNLNSKRPQAEYEEELREWEEERSQNNTTCAACQEAWKNHKAERKSQDQGRDITATHLCRCNRKEAKAEELRETLETLEEFVDIEAPEVDYAWCTEEAMLANVRESDEQVDQRARTNGRRGKRLGIFGKAVERRELSNAPAPGDIVDYQQWIRRTYGEANKPDQGIPMAWVIKYLKEKDIAYIIEERNDAGTVVLNYQASENRGDKFVTMTAMNGHANAMSWSTYEMWTKKYQQKVDAPGGRVEITVAMEDRIGPAVDKQLPGMRYEPSRHGITGTNRFYDVHGGGIAKNITVGRAGAYGSATIRFNSKSRDHSWLSNFHASTIEIAGERYDTVERAFVAAKTRHDPLAHAKLSSTPVNRLRQLGRSVRGTFDSKKWDLGRVALMRRLLRKKFAPGSELAAKLTATGGARLVEESRTDRFWGTTRRQGRELGENKLGSLLEEVRSELKPKTQETRAMGNEAVVKKPSRRPKQHEQDGWCYLAAIPWRYRGYVAAHLGKWPTMEALWEWTGPTLPIKRTRINNKVHLAPGRKNLWRQTERDEHTRVGGRGMLAGEICEVRPAQRTQLNEVAESLMEKAFNTYNTSFETVFPAQDIFQSKYVMKTGWNSYLTAEQLDQTGVMEERLNHIGAALGPRAKLATGKLTTDKLYYPTNARGNPEAEYNLYLAFGPGLGAEQTTALMETLGSMERYVKKRFARHTSVAGRKWGREIVGKMVRERYNMDSVRPDPSTETAIENQFRRDAQTKRYGPRAEQELATGFPDNGARFSNKAQFKPIKSDTFDPTKCGQGIAACSARTCLEYGPTFRQLGYRMAKALKPEHIYDSYISEEQLQYRFNQAREKVIAGQTATTDGKEFDGGQGWHSKFCEQLKWGYFWDNKGSLDKYFQHVRTDWKLISYGLAMATIKDAKASGLPDTKDGNSTVTEVYSNVILQGKGPQVTATKGDDYTRNQAVLRVNEKQLKLVNTYTNIGFKVVLGDSEFCGKIMTPRGMYANPVRTFRKAFAYRARDYQQWAQYQIALRDAVKMWRAQGWESVITENAQAQHKGPDRGPAREYVRSCMEVVDSMSHISKEQWEQVVRPIQAWKPGPTGADGCPKPHGTY